MKTFPLSGRVSIETTGIFFDASRFSVGMTAAVSCGAMTTPLTPWLSRVWTFAASFEMSFAEFVVFRLTPSDFANFGVYEMYEFQKSVSDRG